MLVQEAMLVLTVKGAKMDTLAIHLKLGTFVDLVIAMAMPTFMYPIGVIIELDNACNVWATLVAGIVENA